MQIDSPATLLTSVSAALAVLASIHQTRIGKRQEREAQAVANELQTKAQNHDVYRDMVNDLERQGDRKDAELDRLRKRCADEREEHRQQIVAERAEHRQQTAHLGEIIATLRDVVHSEIATTLAEEGLDGLDDDDLLTEPGTDLQP